MKNDGQPIRVSVPWNSRCTNDPRWLNNVFLFSTEIWAGQLKKHPIYELLPPKIIAWFSMNFLSVWPTRTKLNEGNSWRQSSFLALKCWSMCHIHKVWNDQHYLLLIPTDTKKEMFEPPENSWRSTFSSSFCSVYQKLLQKFKVLTLMSGIKKNYTEVDHFTLASALCTTLEFGQLYIFWHIFS